MRQFLLLTIANCSRISGLEFGSWKSEIGVALTGNCAHERELTGLQSLRHTARKTGHLGSRTAKNQHSGLTNGCRSTMLKKDYLRFIVTIREEIASGHRRNCPVIPTGSLYQSAPADARFGISKSTPISNSQSSTLHGNHFPRERLFVGLRPDFIRRASPVKEERNEADGSIF